MESTEAADEEETVCLMRVIATAQQPSLTPHLHLQLADFGSAFREDDPDNEPTPYLVSRFYRCGEHGGNHAAIASTTACLVVFGATPPTVTALHASACHATHSPPTYAPTRPLPPSSPARSAPEIVLGYKHSPALDMWSSACVLFELYTGAPLFPGDDNNDMLWRFQALRGRLPHRMIRHHLRAAETLGIPAHFDGGPELRFRRRVLDPVTHAPVTKLVDVTAPIEELGPKLAAARAGGDDRRAVGALRDLLERMTTLDPAKRISVREALGHAFVKGRW